MTIPRSERLRITITPAHTKKYADYFIESLTKTLEVFGIINLYDQISLEKIKENSILNL